MELISVGPLYVGLDKECFWEVWREPAAILVHLGTVRLEWDCRVRFDGPTQTNTHQSKDRAASQSHGGLSPT